MDDPDGTHSLLPDMPTIINKDIIQAIHCAHSARQLLECLYTYKSWLLGIVSLCWFQLKTAISSRLLDFLREDVNNINVNA
jgi:hypothetical protein